MPMTRGQHESYCLFGAKALLNRLQDVAREIDGVRKPDDIERIHDMRVATRRLRTAMRLGGTSIGGPWERWREELRWLADALGEEASVEARRGFGIGMRWRDGLSALHRHSCGSGLVPSTTPPF